MRFFLKIIVFAVLFQSLNFALALENKEFFTEKQWKEHAKKYDYTEDFKTIEKKEFKVKNTGNFAAFKNIFIVIVIALIIILIAVTAVSLFKGFNWRVNSTIKVQEEIEIDNIEEADLEGMLQNALNAGLYNEVIRYNYLILIRNLHHHRLIVWKKDKTNGQYIREMYNKRGFELFRSVTINFERVWYGNIALTEADYQNLLPKFNQLNRILLKIESQ